MLSLSRLVKGKKIFEFVMKKQRCSLQNGGGKFVLAKKFLYCYFETFTVSRDQGMDEKLTRTVPDVFLMYNIKKNIKSS